MQWICHIEIQGLYSEAARRSGLTLEGRPIAILRDGRVYDGDRSAFTAGLVLGSPARQLQRDVPGAVAVDWGQIDASPLSRQWWDGCLAHTPFLEPLSPHQAVLALPFPTGELGSQVHQEVELLRTSAGRHGFVGFAGVGPNKLTAQAAARRCRDAWLNWRPGRKESGRPEPSLFVPQGGEAAFLASLPVSYLPLAPDVARRVGRLGLRTIGDAARVSEGELVRQIGGYGRQIWLWSRGIDSEQVKPLYPPRRLERRLPFRTEARGSDGVERSLLRLANSMARELESAGDGCQQVGLVLERLDGEPLRGSRVLPHLVSKAFPLQQALLSLLRELLRTEMAISALSVEVSLIGQMPVQQLSLWDERANREREERLEKAIGLLRERFPVRSVRLGSERSCTWREQMLTFHDPYRHRRQAKGTG